MAGAEQVLDGQRGPAAPSTSTQSCGSSSWPHGRPNAQKVSPASRRRARPVVVGAGRGEHDGVGGTGVQQLLDDRELGRLVGGLGVEQHAQPVVLAGLGEPVVERVEHQARDAVLLALGAYGDRVGTTGGSWRAGSDGR